MLLAVRSRGACLRPCGASLQSPLDGHGVQKHLGKEILSKTRGCSHDVHNQGRQCTLNSNLPGTAVPHLSPQKGPSGAWLHHHLRLGRSPAAQPRPHPLAAAGAPVAGLVGISGHPDPAAAPPPGPGPAGIKRNRACWESGHPSPAAAPPPGSGPAKKRAGLVRERNFKCRWDEIGNISVGSEETEHWHVSCTTN
eukprot:1159278-Pelagomonas_calceolata.AAC.10